MFKLLVIICISLGLYIAHSQSCTTTDKLRTLYGFGNSLTTAKSYSGLNYCKTIKSNPVCCTDTDINSIQTKTNKILTNLTSLATTRDNFLANIQINVLTQLQKSLQNLANVTHQYTAALNKSGMLDQVETFFTISDTIQEAFDSLLSMYGSLGPEFVTYQTSRTTCVVQLAKIQAAAFCLACDSSATSKGYDETSQDITISDRVCTRIVSSCLTYFNASIVQNAIAQLGSSVQLINGLADVIKGLATNNMTALTSFMSLTENSHPSSPLYASAMIPEADAGDWMCNYLFPSGLLDQQALIIGGEVYSSGRLLAKVDSESLSNRMLNTNEFDPDSDESGTTATFNNDPASVQSSVVTADKNIVSSPSSSHSGSTSSSSGSISSGSSSSGSSGSSSSGSTSSGSTSSSSPHSGSTSSGSGSGSTSSGSTSSGSSSSSSSGSSSSGSSTSGSSSSGSSSSCSATSGLRTLYGLSNSLSTPKTYSDLKYCKSLKNSAVCCTDSDINTFQDKTTKVLTNLTAMASTRDRYIKNVQENILPQLKQNLESFSTTMNQYSTLLTANAQVFQSVSTDDTSELNDAMEFMSNSTALLEMLSGDVEGDYISYQKSRSGCVVEMVKLQSAAYCLACDPSATSKGFNPNTLEFSLSTRVCNRLQSSCIDYIEASGTQNAIIDASYGAQIIGAMAGMMQAMANKDYNAIQEYTKEFEDVPEPTNPLVAPADSPDNCDDDSCDWICDSLFNQGLLDQETLLAGGELNYKGSRLLFQDLAGTGSESFRDRVLSSGDFDPDSDEAGVEVSFSNDPSGSEDTANFGNLSVGNVFISMVIVVSSLLLL